MVVFIYEGYVLVLLRMVRGLIDFSIVADMLRITIRYKCPEHVNPAEFFADLISIDYSTPEREEITRGKLASLVNTFSGRISESLYGKYESAADNSGVVVRSSSVKLVRPHVGWWKQFRILLRRAWLQVCASDLGNPIFYN